MIISPSPTLRPSSLRRLTRARRGQRTSDAQLFDGELDPIATKETLFKTVPQYRSGDKFVNVFRNWARLEETHGCPETVDEVYTRASFAFRTIGSYPLIWLSIMSMCIIRTVCDSCLRRPAKRQRIGEYTSMQCTLGLVPSAL